MLGWFAAGLGTITKGVGVLALLMLLPAASRRVRGWRDVRVHVRDWRVLARAAGLRAGRRAVAGADAGWPRWAAHDPAYRAYIDDILFRQTAKRYAQSWDHHQPPWYFLEVMPTMWLPPMLALPWAIPAWRGGCGAAMRATCCRWRGGCWWCVFFSIPSGKRDMYILPALPMACLALAPLLPGIAAQARGAAAGVRVRRWRWRWPRSAAAWRCCSAIRASSRR